MIPGYLNYSHPRGQSVHVGICGSIAVYKALDLIRDFVHTEMRVSVSLTESATQFITPLTVKGLGAELVYTTMFSLKDVYAHLYPGIDPQVFLIAPATANMIAKLANGLADDIISCQALAFNGTILVAPAMNPRMWHNPITQENVSRLHRHSNIEIIYPDTGDVACGDSGTGRLAFHNEIYFRVLKSIAPKDMKGERVLITLGPTREFWDPVRFWSNPSSGKMGAALALSAWMRGADVTCVCGPSDIWLPCEIKKINVISAREMYQACIDLWKDFSLGCLSAAVCDFRPKEKMAHKFKKQTTNKGLVIEFSQNPDILQLLGQRKGKDQILIGFAAESQEDFIELAKVKLDKKNLDLIVANKINVPHSGFNSDQNEVVLVSRKGEVIRLQKMSKADVSWKIWDQIFKV